MLIIWLNYQRGWLKDRLHSTHLLIEPRPSFLLLFHEYIFEIEIKSIFFTDYILLKYLNTIVSIIGDNNLPIRKIRQRPWTIEFS